MQGKEKEDMNNNTPSSNVPPLNIEQFAGSDKENNFFIIKTANDTIREAAQRKNPDPLYLTIWYETEICCLFADSNVGKSILGVQIGADIANSQKVLYFDFELSDKQFQLRYTEEASGRLYEFPQDFYRLEINIEEFDYDTNFEEVIIKNIEQVALYMNAKVLIIDNLTWLCNESEKGDAAGRLMTSLVKLKKKHNLSILVLAHTPKRNMSNPITQNDIAGSKKLCNFFDSVFAIGFSAKDEGQRYIKQLKGRYGPIKYNSNNVLVCCIEKEGAFLHFTEIEFATEKEHLKALNNDEEIALLENVIALRNEGKKSREIAKELGISHSKAYRLLKKYDDGML